MTDENEANKAPKAPDWASLAKEALDLWQDHLTSLANDPQAKAEMARMIQPMGQMFSHWTAMMQQQGHYGTTATQQREAANNGSPNAATGKTADGTGDRADGRAPQADAPARSDAAPAAGDGNLDELARRLAELERQLDERKLKSDARRDGVDSKGVRAVRRKTAAAAESAGSGKIAGSDRASGV
jgi:hypothetical protein